MELRKFFRKFLPIMFLFAFFSTGANGQLDPTFGTNGATTLAVGTKPLASYVLPSGKILVISEELNNSQSQQPYRYHLIRLNDNGTPDTTYGANGVVTLTGLQSSQQFSRFFNCTRQTDGKLLCVDLQSVYRFNETDGTLDATFSGDGVHTPNVDPQASEKLAAVTQASDGKIIVAGTVLNNSEPSKLFLVRYETNGNLDSTFGDQGGFIIHNLQYPTVSEVHLQSTGKILTVPQKEPSASNANFFLAGAIQRFNANGTVDNTFTPVVYQSGNAPKLRSFKLLGGDRFATAESVTISDQLLRTHRNIAISRYTSEGDLETTFGTNGRVIYDVTSSMTDDAIALGEQADGRILVSGATDIQYNRTSTFGLSLSIAMLGKSGKLIGKYLAANLNFFYTNAAPTLLYDGQIFVQPDGKILTTATRTTIGGVRQILLTRSTNVPFETKRLHGTPFAFFSSNVANAGIYRPSSRNWYFNPALEPAFFGLSNDVLVPSDFVGDFRMDLAVFRPSEGMWYIAKDSNFNPAQNFLAIAWGRTGDIPIPRDYDGDSKSDVAVFRPEDGVWYIRNSADNSFRFQQWGMNGDKPVAGDYDGDGIDDLAVFRPSNGTWYINRSSDGGNTIVSFGMPGDIPIPEDYDGDGRFDIGVWRPSTGNWYIWRSTNGGISFYNFGLPGDIPIPSDFDGDRRTDIGVWRPSTQNWFIIYSNDNSLGQFQFGIANDIPAQGRN